MIIVQLTGGLGNQLFQYAMGRALAIKSNTTLKIDISFFETYEWHEYSLAPFCLEAQIATKEEVALLKEKSESFIERFKKKFFNAQPILIDEKSLLYDPAYRNIKSPAYLVGYWQCEKYFLPHQTAIRKEFAIAKGPSPANEKILQQIAATNAVSLHIRRGNFVNVDFVSKAHGTCSMEYYEEAMQLMASKGKQPTFFIFSDDIPWVRENLVMNHPHVFVDVNDAATDYEDLRLMYSCRHHIMANSTFSWWGAWLNQSPDKTVVSPKQWFADEQRNKDAVTIIPEKWIRL